MTTTNSQPPADELLMLIDGAPSAARSGATYESTDPFTGQPWARVPDAGAADVDAAVAAARAALAGPWGSATATQRGKLLRRLGDLIARDAGRLAELETRDNGKLLREMAGQMAGLPDWYYYFAGLADKVQGSVIPSDKPDYLVYTLNEPVGVVAAIVPWNSPPPTLT
jgi:(Z)-2-((N-methylformamido)methylene)-5-hydroxybutyrolactone dehydrogenase